MDIYQQVLVTADKLVVMLLFPELCACRVAVLQRIKYRSLRGCGPECMYIQVQ